MRVQVLHSLRGYGTLVPGHGGVMAGQFGFVCKSGHAMDLSVGVSTTVA